MMLYERLVQRQDDLPFTWEYVNGPVPMINGEPKPVRARMHMHLHNDSEDDGHAKTIERVIQDYIDWYPDGAHYMFYSVSPIGHVATHNDVQIDTRKHIMMSRYRQTVSFLYE